MNQPAETPAKRAKRSGRGGAADAVAPRGTRVALLRIFALATVATSFAFLINNYLNFWRGWPGLPNLFAHLGWLGFDPLRTGLAADAVTLGWIQIGLYFAAIAGVAVFVARTPGRTLRVDSVTLGALTAFIARAAFWSVLLVGLADMVISFLRVEGLLVASVGEDLAKSLGRSRFRGEYVHYPLVAVSFVIAYFSRSIGFHWLAFLIVVAEIHIVIARFIFSYEQAFMADLVRFWYGALFLFASAYTLVQEGHVRVDILYAAFSDRGKAWCNAIGSVTLGAPLCWVIMTMGLWTRSDVINGPLFDFEVTQAGYGLYVKYMLAGFLLVFAVTMLIQFMGYFLSSSATLMDEPKPADGPVGASG